MARTCHVLYEWPGCYHSASKTHVRDRIFKFISVHASVIYKIPFPEFAEFSENSAPFSKNSIEAVSTVRRQRINKEEFLQWVWQKFYLTVHTGHSDY